jgi:hypothetical protein
VDGHAAEASRDRDSVAARRSKCRAEGRCRGAAACAHCCAPGTSALRVRCVTQRLTTPSQPASASAARYAQSRVRHVGPWKDTTPPPCVRPYQHHSAEQSAITVLIPPAYGVRGGGFETYTGDGSISYWNSYVGVSQMGGQGELQRSGNRSGDHAKTRSGAPTGSFNAAAAGRDERVLHGKAGCATCHTPPTYTDVLSGPDPRGPFCMILPKSVPNPSTLRGVPQAGTERRLCAESGSILRTFTTGAPATLADVVHHYDQHFGLRLSANQKADLVEFLKSL